MQYVLIVVGFGWFISSLRLQAAEAEPQISEQSELPWDEYLIQQNRELSGEIDVVGKKIDLYLANDELVKKPNKSRITLHNGFHFSEGGEFNYAPHVGVKLHLPNTQRKLQLQFTTYSQDETARGINRNRSQVRPPEPQVGTSLTFFQDLGKLRTEFRPLLEYRDRFQTSHLLIFTSDASKGNITFKPELQLFGRSDTGTGQFFALNIDYKFNEKNSASMINEQQYTDADNTLSVNEGLRWVHAYNKKFAIENSLIFEFNNRPAYHLDQFVFTPSFRHRLYPNVLHYGVSPSLRCKREQKFKGRGSLDLKFEIVF